VERGEEDEKKGSQQMCKEKNHHYPLISIPTHPLRELKGGQSKSTPLPHSQDLLKITRRKGIRSQRTLEN